MHDRECDCYKCYCEYLDEYVPIIPTDYDVLIDKASEPLNSKVWRPTDEDMPHD